MPSFGLQPGPQAPCEAPLVVGAGIVGASVAYHLAERGWRDVVVVDQGPIPATGGSTSHAPAACCGWGTGGFKAAPASGWVMAHTVANDASHELNRPFALERFETGALIDEHGAAAVAH